MATSGETSYSVTARDIVKTALQESAIVGLNKEPTANELSACIGRLNGMLKSWQTKGVLWKQETISDAGAAG